MFYLLRKGHKIFKDDLIYQWISLDFIKTKLLSNLGVCEKYIKQLLGLSFFQQPVSPKDVLLVQTSEAYYTQATFFTMHDLVHDLATSLLGNQFLDQSQQGNTRGSSCQYALLSDCSKPLELSLTSCARLMAMRFLDCCRSKLIGGAAFAPARSLRVLDLRECAINNLPDSIGQLKQLRYLNAPRIHDRMVAECITNLLNLVYLCLCESRILRLPESIGEMGSLMHLDLSYCSDLEELSDSFWNLETLVHLDLSNCWRVSGVTESLWRLSRLEHLNISDCSSGLMPRAVGGLTQLQYLDLSRVSCFGLQEVLVNLTKLRYLNLYSSLDGRFDEAGIDSLLECASSLSNLEYLNLRSNGKLHTIPETIGNLQKLNTLDLSGCCNLQRLPASLSAIDSLKFLHTFGCHKLDESNLPQSMLPHFVVCAGDGESSSNLSELEDKYPTFLEISRLENVNSTEEAERIKLAKKQSIKLLELAWTRDAKRFVDDWDVLGELEPPGELTELTVKGYSSIGFPSWIMSIATYLPHLRKVVLEDLPNCNVLPPLGQLPNLSWLDIRGMDSIRKIDGDLYGGKRAFPRLRHFVLSRMKSLEEWNAAYVISEDGSTNELAFPETNMISIDRCPLLKFKACLPPSKDSLHIRRSDQVLLSSWENRDYISASSSARTTWLDVKCCEVPLHQWSLLRLLPYLTYLKITDCSDLTCSSTDLLRCISSLETLTVQGCDRDNIIVALPERLGDLTSLTKLEIRNYPFIRALPDSIQQLSCLQRLLISGCPELVRWCESEENAIKLAHIKEREFYGI